MATARLVTRDNGVTVLELTMNGSVYGDYPISGNHDAAQQIKMMIGDAKEYGQSITLCEEGR